MSNLRYYQSSFALGKYGILAQESNIQKIEIENTNDDEEFKQCTSFIKELQCLNNIEIYSMDDDIVSKLAKIIPLLKTQSNEICVEFNQECNSEMQIIQLLNELSSRFQRFSFYIHVPKSQTVEKIKKAIQNKKYNFVSYCNTFLHVQKGDELYHLMY